MQVSACAGAGVALEQSRVPCQRALTSSPPPGRVSRGSAAPSPLGVITMVGGHLWSRLNMRGRWREAQPAPDLSRQVQTQRGRTPL